MSDQVLNGIIIALKLIETASNVSIAIAKLNAVVTTARAEGRDISLEELKALAEGNDALTDEVLALLGKPRV